MHGDGCVLVVAQRDFKFHLPDVARYALVVGLLVFGDHIKSVADMNVDVLIFGGVVDAILAGKENAAFGVLLIDTDVTRRKRNSEAGLFFVFELVIDHHGIFQRCSWVLCIVVIVVLPVHDENLLHWNATALEQADLLGFFVFDRSLSAERVQMVFAEAFLLELRGSCLGLHGPVNRHVPQPASLLNPIQLSGHQLEPRIMKGRAAVVDDGNPAIQVSILVIPRHGKDVIGVPRQIARQVRGFNLLLFRAGVFQRHQQRGALVEIRRDFGEAITLGKHSGHDVVADFPDRPVVIGKQGSLDLFALG